VNWNQLGQVPVPRGFRSPKGHEASSITKVCGAFDVLVVVDVVDVVVVDVVGGMVDDVVVVEVVVKELLVVGVDEMLEVVVVLEGPEVAA